MVQVVPFGFPLTAKNMGATPTKEDTQLVIFRFSDATLVSKPSVEAPGDVAPTRAGRSEIGRNRMAAEVLSVSERTSPPLILWASVFLGVSFTPGKISNANVIQLRPHPLLKAQHVTLCVQADGVRRKLNPLAAVWGRSRDLTKTAEPTVPSLGRHKQGHAATTSLTALERFQHRAEKWTTLQHNPPGPPAHSRHPDVRKCASEFCWGSTSQNHG